MKQFNARGFSLVEVMIGAALLGGLSIAGMKMFSSQQKQSKAIEYKSFAKSSIDEIRQELTDGDNCIATFKDLVASSFTNSSVSVKKVARNPTTGVIVSTADKYVIGTIMKEPFKVLTLNIDTDTDWEVKPISTDEMVVRFYLKTQFIKLTNAKTKEVKSSEALGGKATKVYRIAIVGRLDGPFSSGGKIVGCTTENGAIEGLWHITNGGINYNTTSSGNKVAIGISDAVSGSDSPGFLLHLKGDNHQTTLFGISQKIYLALENDRNSAHENASIGLITRHATTTGGIGFGMRNADGTITRRGNINLGAGSADDNSIIYWGTSETHYQQMILFENGKLGIGVGATTDEDAMIQVVKGSNANPHSIHGTAVGSDLANIRMVHDNSKLGLNASSSGQTSLNFGGTKFTINGDTDPLTTNVAPLMEFSFVSGQTGGKVEIVAEDGLVLNPSVGTPKLTIGGAVLEGVIGTDELTINGGQAVVNSSGLSVTVGDITSSGNVYGIELIATSDERLKKEITNIPDALDKIMALEGVTFKWRDSYVKKNGLSRGRKIGLVAQDVEKVLPELVSSSGKYKGVNYSQLVAVLINAMKEQQGTIENLSSKIQKLEDRVYLKKCID